MKQVVILGASRGLGAELSEAACKVSGISVMGFGRKEDHLSELKRRHSNFEYQIADFAKSESQETVLRYLSQKTNAPLAVFYVAGGGPYGPYEKRPWSSHEWSWQVTFLFPARIVHTLLSDGNLSRTQILLVGSSVAESSADPGAASYCAAKHALRGLYETLHQETPGLDLRLFSPGYMDTDLLPKNATVRTKGIYHPRDMAQELWSWSQSPDIGGHKVYAPHPTC